MPGKHISPIFDLQRIAPSDIESVSVEICSYRGKRREAEWREDHTSAAVEIHLRPTEVDQDGRNATVSVATTAEVGGQAVVEASLRVKARLAPNVPLEAVSVPENAALMADLAWPYCAQLVASAARDMGLSPPMISKPRRMVPGYYETGGSGRLERGTPSDARPRPTFHMFTIDQSTFAFDPWSSSAFRLDEAGAAAGRALQSGAEGTVLGRGDAGGEGEARQASEQWDALLSKGFFQADAAEATVPDRSHWRRTVELSLTHRCTLRCRYCYSAHDERGRRVPMDMSRSVIDAALSWAVGQ